MTNYTELKRLAEAAKAAFSNSYEHTSNRVDFEMAASPDVVLSMIAEIDRLRCDVEVLQRLHDEDGIEHNKLRTQNQALLDALEDATDEIESWGAYASEYFQEKHDLAGNVAKFRAIAQAEGDETFGLSMSMFANQRDYQDEKNRRLRARLDFQEGGV